MLASEVNPMFDAFDGSGDGSARRRLAASSLVSFVLLTALATAVAIAASGVVAEPEKETEVVFQMPPPTATPTPPPEPPTQRPPDAKVQKVKTPRPVVAPPTQVPDEELKEADESNYEVTQVESGFVDYGGTGTIGGGVNAPPAPPPPPAPVKPTGPIELPKGGIPPKCAAGINGNAELIFPESARQLGIVGRVVVKCVVTTDGRIKDIKVVQGKEPFVSEALATIKKWRCDPALVKGDPTMVYWTIPITFQLED